MGGTLTFFLSFNHGNKTSYEVQGTRK